MVDAKITAGKLPKSGCYLLVLHYNRAVKAAIRVAGHQEVARLPCTGLEAGRRERYIADARREREESRARRAEPY